MTAKKIWRITPLILLILLVITPTVMAATSPFTADSTTITSGTPFGTLGQGDSGWATQLTKLASALLQAGHLISIIMVALGGIMVAFGIESGSKTVWNVILGIGLALNLSTIFLGSGSPFGGFEYVPTTTDTPDKFSISIVGDDSNTDGKSTNFNILGDFMDFYTKSVCMAGAAKLVPIAYNLTLILVIIDATMKVSTDLLGGDKVKFFTQVLLKTGFLLFLIHNWFGGTGMNLMGSLGEAFQDIGFAAGGVDNGTLSPNSIINNGAAMFTGVYNNMDVSITSPVNSLCQIIILIAVVLLAFLTGLEMFMARIEFYTMALITIPLIPFGVIDQLKFLWERALGAMFNLAVKLCVICFLQSVITKTFTDYSNQLAEMLKSDKDVSATLLIQLLLLTLIIYFLVKKIPELVQGLLSGTPSLTGGSMMQTAKGAAQSAGKAATNVTQAGATVASGGANIAAAGAKGAVAGAKTAFASSGGGRSGLMAAAVGGLKGGVNNMAGATNAGIRTLAEAGLLGNKEHDATGKETGKRTGGLLSGIYNAGVAGEKLADGFDTRRKNKSGDVVGSTYRGLDHQVKGTHDKIKRGTKNTIANTVNAVQTTASVGKTIIDNLKKP